MPYEFKVLLLEDSSADAELIVRELRRAGTSFVVKRVDNEPDFRSQLEAFSPDIIVSDYGIPGYSGMSALELAQSMAPDTPFIFVSGTVGEETAIKLVKQGATDYVLKDNLARLVPAVERALHEAHQRVERKRAQDALRRQQALLRDVIDTDPSLIFVKDWDGRFVLVNKAVADIYGSTVDDLVGKTDADFNSRQEEVEHFLRDDREVMAGAHPKFIPEEPVTNSETGETRWFQTVKIPLLAADEGSRQVLGVATDVTLRKDQEEKITRLNRIHEVLSGINSAIVRMHDRQELFNEVCRIAVEHGRFRLAFIALLDVQSKEINTIAWKGDNPDFVMSLSGSSCSSIPEEQTLAGSAIRNKTAAVCNDLMVDSQSDASRDAAINQGYRSIAVLPIMVSGKAVGTLALCAADANVFDEQEMKFLTELAADISFALDYIAKEEKLHYLAYYDPLTGLPNRNLCHDRVDQLIRTAVQENKIVVVGVMDLERFSMVNATLGRQGGDTLIGLVAERLKTAVQEPGIVARIGVDRFATVGMLNAEADIARILEEPLMNCLAQPFEIGFQELRVAAKSGAACYPNDGADAATLFKNAETALKNAKDSGEKYLFYASGMDARIAGRLTLESRLQRAVENREFTLYYQPKVHLVTGQILGLEALIRWNDPETGLVPPLKFIPVLEETGMILDVGDWVIEQAVADYHEWQSRGLKAPRVAVNVSQLQLRKKDFVDKVRKAVGNGSNSESNLDLEITENMIMEDISSIIPRLDALKELKVGIAIDDFGTGYSSLSYLTKLPVDELKIDRTFIANMANNPDDLTMVSTIISLAHTLDLNVVAEGVETTEQANLLRLFKCDEIQGYLFSPPVPTDKMEIMLTEGRRLTMTGSDSGGEKGVRTFGIMPNISHLPHLRD
jgi:diguanylate cyclase (GGDEF)-like protein/PAS domain S-box-containing protein